MKTNLPELTMIGRQMGKTTALCKAAKEIGATVVAHSAAEAKRLTEVYGVKATDLQTVLRGTRGPYLVDTHAVSVAAMQYERHIETLAADAEKWRTRAAATDRQKDSRNLEIQALTAKIEFARAEFEKIAGYVGDYAQILAEEALEKIK